MTSSTLFRLSFVFSEGQAQTFNKNLERIITVMFFDNENIPLTIDEIICNIKSETTLDFTADEIKKCLTVGSEKNIFESVEIKKTYRSNTFETKKYKLSIDAFTKINKKEEQNLFYCIVKRFLDDNPHINVEIESLVSLLKEYFYEVFNINKQAVLDLINANHNVEDYNIKSLSNEKKDLISKFLSWENKEKDGIIFNIVSYCVDYCSLTTRCDMRTFSEIISGKSFFLDTNVIFRLAGFNNNERQAVMSTFINHCKKSNIKLFYTNYTYSEIKDTINKIVSSIKYESLNSGLLKAEYYSYFVNDNMDFYRQYEKWRLHKHSKRNDFNEFEKHLMKRIEKVLVKFKKVVIPSGNIIDKDLYENYCKSLEDYKHNKHNVTCDITNFLHVKSLREKEHGTNMYDLKNFFITEDIRLCSWEKEMIRDCIPICVLPSVWCSIILKIKGRTNDDYNSFSLFLNLRYRTVEDDISNKKQEIFSIVKGLDELTETKEAVLDYIKDKLSGSHKEEIKPQIIVDEAVSQVYNKKTQKLLEEKEDELKKEQLKLLEEKSIKISKTRQKVIATIERIIDALIVFFAICALFMIVYSFKTSNAHFYLQAITYIMPFLNLFARFIVKRIKNFLDEKIILNKLIKKSKKLEEKKSKLYEQ